MARTDFTLAMVALLAANNYVDCPYRPFHTLLTNANAPLQGLNSVVMDNVHHIRSLSSAMQTFQLVIQFMIATSWYLLYLRGARDTLDNIAAVYSLASRACPCSNRTVSTTETIIATAMNGTINLEGTPTYLASLVLPDWLDQMITSPTESAIHVLGRGPINDVTLCSDVELIRGLWFAVSFLTLGLSLTS